MNSFVFVSRLNINLNGISIKIKRLDFLIIIISKNLLIQKKCFYVFMNKTWAFYHKISMFLEPFHKAFVTSLPFQNVEQRIWIVEKFESGDIISFYCPLTSLSPPHNIMHTTTTIQPLLSKLNRSSSCWVILRGVERSLGHSYNTKLSSRSNKNRKWRHRTFTNNSSLVNCFTGAGLV